MIIHSLTLLHKQLPIGSNQQDTKEIPSSTERHIAPIKISDLQPFSKRKQPQRYFVSQQLKVFIKWREVKNCLVLVGSNRIFVMRVPAGLLLYALGALADKKEFRDEKQVKQPLVGRKWEPSGAPLNAKSSLDITSAHSLLRGGEEEGNRYLKPKGLVSEHLQPGTRAKPNNVMICHIPPENPSACHNITINANAVSAHLRNHGDLEGDCVSSCDSFCASVTNCLEDSSKNQCECCGCDSSMSCFVGERIECGEGKISVCQYSDEEYSTACMNEADVAGHLAEHKTDYYGKCEEDIFVENSVLLNVAPDQGVEDHGLYEVNYDVTYNEDGIIVLANSFDVIDGVICSPGSVQILFSKPLTSESLAPMFPEGAILVVDGDLFGTVCDVYPPRESQEARILNVGFLIVQTSHVDGSIVTVTGPATILDAIFEEQDMHYQMHSNSTRRELASLDWIEAKIVMPPSAAEVFPVQWTCTADVDGFVDLGDFAITSRMVRGEGFLPVYYPAFEWAGELSWQVIVKFTSALKISSWSLKWSDEEEPVPPFPIPSASVAFPSTILKLLKIDGIATRAGIVVAFPVTWEVDLDTSYMLDIKSTAEFDLGLNRVKVGLSYNPLIPLPLGLSPIVEKLESNKASRIDDGDQPDQDEGPPISESTLMALTAQFGIEPQVRLDFFNLAWIGVGTFIGFESFSTLRSNPYPPTDGFNCGGCHFLESDGGLIVKDLFVKYKPFEFGGTKPKKLFTLVNFYLKWIWYKFCLASLADHISCGNTCCDPSDTCVESRCQSVACLTECCDDDQCSPPMKCNTVKGECECPYECCSNANCVSTTPNKDICDLTSHKCTNEDHDIEEEPFLIVHIGDSYSAGTGAGAYAAPPGCYRSNLNWGKLYSDSLKDHNAVRFVNRACNGGVMDNYFNKRLLESSDSPCRSRMQDEVFEDDGVTCKRFVEAQYKSLSTDVDLVLMTIGGNDLKFSDIVKQCFVMWARDGDGCEDKVSSASAYLTSVDFKGKLVSILEDIADRIKPQGKVILSAYPHLLMDKAYILGSYDAGTAIRDLALLLDTVQQEAVEEANASKGRDFAFYFDKTKDVFSTHEPDPSVLAKNPNRWLNEFLEPGSDIMEWYHPNVIGHEKWAEALSTVKFDAIETMGTNSGANNVDLVFVIDTTGSMSPYINSVKVEMANIVDQIAATFQSYRIAIVTYQDFPGHGNYVSRVDLDFSDDFAEIESGINAITLGSGGDSPETVLSGLNTALDLDWRPGVSKVTILMGDAPAKLFNGEEPNTGLTDSLIIAKSESLDPVQIMAVDLGNLIPLGSPVVANIVEGTGGSIESGTGGVVAAIERILDQVSKQPFAWFGESIVARVGYPVVFDASGSFDPLGEEITSYEWDFNGDGVYDELTEESSMMHTYNDPFNGLVLLRVTSAGGKGIASAHVIANEEGSIHQLTEELCGIDETSGLPILEDEDGNLLNCMLDSSMWPTIDKPGVIDDNSAIIGACLEALNSPIVYLLSCDVQGKIRVLDRQVGTGDYYDACNSMGDMTVHLGGDGYSCVEMCEIFLGPASNLLFS